MATFSRFHKLALMSLGALGGGLAYYHLNNNDDEKKLRVHNNAWPKKNCNCPTTKWNKNWDCRDPESLVKPPCPGNAQDENRYNEEIEKVRSTATRHLILIRHGQYNVSGETDKERVLTELGRRQAELTGERLKNLDIKWDLLVRSTMTRAQETAELIAKHLPEDLLVKNCQLIEEGAPIQPEPPVAHWQPELKFFQDSARIEAGYRRYFHRAPPDQAKDTYTLLVCHANVIRFFVCKALQFPPEAWLRMSLNHGSITWISILPSGNVVLRCMGETGHMPPQCVSARNIGRRKRRSKNKKTSTV
ncbi:serine/threonine-protein phosphatase Pgam5, mitochondrial-like isoform X2 [Pectinophora gossypiella]|uniref:serine/threonine-protein phosphatase Pgam5, mitochondrial-like isoform X2 n=1 Tax=Pectinophora gossypiella TaxID=13191 RepID=UPI00214E8602|nr:serine/threonine-protein phosphatase Pgam5, mitochondrial-like isoform X2 [Pectinophora gossypiella]